MAGCTVVYGGVAWGLMMRSSVRAGGGVGGGDGKGDVGDRGGAIALVQAGCVNMGLRIGFGVWFVDHWIRTNFNGGGEVRARFWRRCVPDGMVVAGAVLMGSMLWYVGLESGSDVRREVGAVLAAAVGMGVLM